jgi:hypothetical protein
MDTMNTKHTPRVALGLVLLLTGCYTQDPLTTPLPVPGTRIVAHVTDSGVVAMTEALGAAPVEVEGVIDAADAKVWDLRLVRVEYRGGRSSLWNRELVRFPRAALTAPTEKHLDKGKSWLVAGVVTATALLAARVFAGFSGTETPNPQPPPPN